MIRLLFIKILIINGVGEETAPNGEIVGASTQGYANKNDCKKNAIRNGCDIDD